VISGTIFRGNLLAAASRNPTDEGVAPAGEARTKAV